jgi:hypothetical protein
MASIFLPFLHQPTQISAAIRELFNTLLHIREHARLQNNCANMHGSAQLYVYGTQESIPRTRFLLGSLKDLQMRAQVCCYRLDTIVIQNIAAVILRCQEV